MVAKLKIQRMVKGFSQVVLWEKTGIPQWRLSLIERGVAASPDEAGKISQALDVPVEELFETSGTEILGPRYMRTKQTESLPGSERVGGGP